MPPTTDGSFTEVFESIRDVQGWMTKFQARRLWNRASALHDGDRVVEIGSYHGRSAIVLASAAPAGVEVIAIDPHGGNDRGPQEYEGEVEDGQRDHEAFVTNLTRAGVIGRVRHLRKASQDATPDVPGAVELLYIDGAHRYHPARADIVRWGAKVAPGGTLLIHDTFSSVGVTLALATTLLVGDQFRYVGRSGTMAEFRREELDRDARLRNMAQLLAQLPYFARNVAFKLLILAGLRPVTKVLGGTGEWPY